MTDINDEYGELGKQVETKKVNKKKRYYSRSPYKFFYSMDWTEAEAITWCDFVNYKCDGDREEALRKMTKYAVKRKE
jgi:hypothetical protein